MGADLEKAPIVLRTLDRLWTRLGPDAFDIVDHWECDLTAVGVASPRDHGVLAYIASYDNGFYVELELPPRTGDDFPYQVAGTYSGLDFEQVAVIVGEHLARA